MSKQIQRPLQRDSLSKAEREELRRLLALDGGATRSGVAQRALVEAADKQLIERAALAALDKVHGVVPQMAAQHSLTPLAVGAASLLGVAGLAVFALRPAGETTVERAPAPVVQAAHVAEPVMAAGLPVEPVGDAASVSGSEVGAVAAAVSGSAASVVAAPVVVTAADLFRRANAARRAGDDAHAKRGYQRLIASFPLSPEASPAAVSLAKLLLAGGAAAEADRVLTRYFARDRGSRQLDEEALVKHAKALGALGQRERELAKWRALLERHPNSVYVGLAKQRLALLERGSGRVDP